MKFWHYLNLLLCSQLYSSSHFPLLILLSDDSVAIMIFNKHLMTVASKKGSELQCLQSCLSKVHSRLEGNHDSQRLNEKKYNKILPPKDICFVFRNALFSYRHYFPRIQKWLAVVFKSVFPVNNVKILSLCP